MTTLTYPALLVLLVGFIKLAFLFTLVFFANRLILKGLGTTKNLNISLVDKDGKSKSSNKAWGLGFILVIASVLIIEIFSSPYAMVYADNEVINALMTNTQAVSVMVIFGLLSLASALMYKSYSSRMDTTDKKAVPKLFLTVKYLILALNVIAMILTFLPILFYLVEVLIN